MQRLEVSGAVRPLYGSLGVKGLILLDYRTRGLNLELGHTSQNNLDRDWNRVPHK
jgi:hypothetical protein